MAVVNVAVRSYPRTDKIPRVLCTHNSEELRLRSPTAFTTFSVGEIIPSDSSSSTSPVCPSNDIIADQSSDSKATSPTIGQEENKLSVAGALSWKETERIETDLRKMALVKNKMTECTLSNLNASNTTLPRSDSMDSMLGDSLLDPPQDLQKMPPKRYQSPSRCGSPSIETPEHLLFRSHYNSIENTSSLSQGHKIKGIDTNYSESAKSRLARQDLLRRRDIGQTFGIAGSCHGLHPRMLLNVGHNQPRLSLPPKQASTITNPAIISSGPYRAFPPERGMHQFSYMDRSSCNQTYLTPNCDVEDIDKLSQNFENMQVKCNTSGKYKCDQLQHDCLDVNQATENTTCDMEVQHIDANEISKNTNKESLKEPTNPHSDISRPSEEYTSSFALGAKKKSMISLSRTSTPKKNDHFLSFSSKRKHYKHFESEDDTGMEVAEYALDDVSGKNINTSLANEYKSKTEQFDERQTNFQKEMTNILEGLEPKKKMCTSRRSSLKDEDRLFPHKCNCSKDSTQPQYQHIQDETTRYPMFNNSSVTQVYRSDAQTPSLMPSPLLQFKSIKNEPVNNLTRKPLDKAEILLGAIMRTCERNKHLEYKDDPAADSSISSKEDSYSVGAVRKSPEERKNSAGDADDEDEGNTSSDNGSSILSSPSSSDEEDFQHQQSSSSDMGWYKSRYKGVVSRAKKKNIASEKKSDSSSSQCSPCNLIPSTNSSSTSTFNENQSNIYVKTQSICDNEENTPGLKSASNLCLNKETTFVEDLDDKVLINSTKQASKNKAREAAIDIQHDLSCNDEAAMKIKKLKEGSVNENYTIRGNNDNIESKLENEPASESVETTKLGLAKLRTLSENLHEFSNKTHDIVLHDKTHQEELSNCYKLQQLEQVAFFEENSKDTASIDKKPFCDNDSSDEKVFIENNIEPTKEELYKCATNINNGISIPTMVQKDNFRKTLNSATSMVFHRNTGLPLSSSPAPLRRGAYDFGYDSSINTPNAIKR